MKIKKGFVLRDICGENIIVAEGKENIDFTKIISMNESAALLWEGVKSSTQKRSKSCYARNTISTTLRRRTTQKHYSTAG